MFIQDSDTINVEIYYKKSGRAYIALSAKDFDEEEESDKPKYKKVVIVMKLLTWSLFNELQEDASIYSEDMGKNVFNYKKYKEDKLKKLIVNWDVTTEKDGKVTPVPVNTKNILSLSPNVAETILNTYDSLSLVGDDEEKK